MIVINDSVILDEIITHVSEQITKAKLIDTPFELGVMSDIRPSQILDLIHDNEDTLKEIGMTKFEWYDDALRSPLQIAGENLLFSMSRVRK